MSSANASCLSTKYYFPTSSLAVRKYSGIITVQNTMNQKFCGIIIHRFLRRAGFKCKIESVLFFLVSIQSKYILFISFKSNFQLDG